MALNWFTSNSPFIDDAQRTFSARMVDSSQMADMMSAPKRRTRWDDEDMEEDPELISPKRRRFKEPIPRQHAQEKDVPAQDVDNNMEEHIMPAPQQNTRPQVEKQIQQQLRQRINVANGVYCDAVSACRLGESKDCPITDAEFQKLYILAGGTGPTKRKPIVEETFAKKTPVGKAMCNVVTKLVNTGSLLDARISIPGADRMTPSQYLDTLAVNQNNFVRVLPDGNTEPIFMRSGIKDLVKSNSLCIMKDDKTSLDDIILKLSREQEFVRHYFTPESHLPGLLVAHSTGSGKTITAIATATSSWVFANYTVLWVTANDALKQQYATDALAKFGDQVALALARGDDSGQIKSDIETLDNKERQARMSKGGLVTPVTYEQIKRFLQGTSNTTEHGKLLATTGERLLLVIDEAHLFLEWLEKSGDSMFRKLLDKLDNSRRVSKHPMKIILLTATPMYKSPLTLFKLLALVGARKQLRDQIEKGAQLRLTNWPLDDRSDWKRWIRPEDGLLNQDAVNAFTVGARGLVSYVDVSSDALRIPQIANDTWVKIRVSDIQDRNLRQCYTSSKSSKSTSDKRSKKQCDPDETFAEYDERYFYDPDIEDPEFKELILKQIPFLSPKFVALSNRISHIDQQLLCKHVIAVRNWKTAKMIWSMLISIDEFTPVQQKDGRLVYGGPHGIAFLSFDNAAKIYDSDRIPMKKLVPTIGTPEVQENTFRARRKSDDEDTQRSSYIAEVLKAFNSGGATGSKIRVLIIDETLSTGTNLFDVKYLHLMEPTRTSRVIVDSIERDPNRLGVKPEYKLVIDSLVNREKKDSFEQVKNEFDVEEKQIVGRVTRTCGMPSFEFQNGVGWTLDVFRYYALQAPRDGNPVENDYVFEMLHRNDKSLDISTLLLNIQLRRILIDITIEKFFPIENGGAVALADTSPNTNYYVENNVGNTLA